MSVCKKDFFLQDRCYRSGALYEDSTIEKELHEIACQFIYISCFGLVELLGGPTWSVEEWMGASTWDVTLSCSFVERIPLWCFERAFWDCFRLHNLDWKRGLLEKGVFSKCPFSRDFREFRSKASRDLPKSRSEGESDHFLEILGCRRNDPFQNDPFPRFRHKLETKVGLVELCA